MMEAVGVAASIIAVVEITAKVTSLCFKYSHAVKDAQKDILRLQKEVKSLKEVLKEVQQLLHDPNRAKLSASPKALASLDDCSSQLIALHDKLVPRKKHKYMSKLGFWDLKWPLESKEAEKIIGELERLNLVASSIS